MRRGGENSANFEVWKSAFAENQRRMENPALALQRDARAHAATAVHGGPIKNGAPEESAPAYIAGNADG
jgi:hypothetical protein